MGLPKSPEARDFRRCAIRRYHESEILRAAALTTGAVYLAGYGVECILKALILDAVPKTKRGEVLASFHGNSAHSYHWLRQRDLESGGASFFPKEVTRSFTFVDAWSTELRYSAKEIKPKDADAFLKAAKAIIDWANERF